MSEYSSTKNFQMAPNCGIFGAIFIVSSSSAPGQHPLVLHHRHYASALASELCRSLKFLRSEDEKQKTLKKRINYLDLKL